MSVELRLKTSLRRASALLVAAAAASCSADTREPSESAVTSSAAALGATAPSQDTLMFHGGPKRQGWNANETILTPANVGGGGFGPIWSSQPFDSITLGGTTCWVESAVTWNSRPPLGGVISGTLNASGAAGASYSFDVSSYVSAAHAAGSETLTIGLHAANLGATRINLQAREAGSNAARLVVEP